MSLITKLDLAGCHEDARALAERFCGQERRLHVVTCGYDTGFDDVERQVREKLAQLAEVFPPEGPVRAALLVVDDTRDPTFQGAVERGGGRVFGLRTGRGGSWGQKGLALREGFLRALEEEPDWVAYVNLNLKSHAAQLATGLRLVVDDHLEAAIGSRDPRIGGAQAGAGALGVFKSRVYNRLALAAFPELRGLRDTNGPMKIFTPRATRAITERARIREVGLDVEWLMVLRAHGLSWGSFGLHWQQRRGSRPPWARTPRMVLDLARLRRAYRRGHLGPQRR